MNNKYLKSKKINAYSIYAIAEILDRGFTAKELDLSPDQHQALVIALNTRAKETSELSF